MDYLEQHIESLIFAAPKSISIKEISTSLEKTFELKINKKDILEAIETLKSKYQSETFSFEIIEIGGGYQFMTKGAYHKTIASFIKLSNKKKLSKAALETLAIIAYKQPITRVEVDQIRGVNSDYSIQKLLEKELVEIEGRSDAPGRPLIYKTGYKFMNYFGLRSLEDLPKPKDFKTIENQVGAPATIEVKK